MHTHNRADRAIEPDAIIAPDGSSERTWTRRKSYTERSYGEWWPDFIEALADEGNVSAAAVFAGVSRRTVYDARDRDMDFREAWDDANERYKDRIRSAIHERAIDGTRTIREIWLLAKDARGRQIPVHVTDEITVKFSDTLLLALARSRIPEEFSDRRGDDPIAAFDLDGMIAQLAIEWNQPEELVRREWDQLAAEAEQKHKRTRRVQGGR